MRSALVVVATLALGHPARAGADDACKTSNGPKAERALALTLAPDEVHGGRVFAFPPDAAFPAVSADGQTLAELFMDGEDFSGAPITTLVLWSTKTGAVTGSFGLGGSGPDKPAAQARRAEQAMLDRANARLATSKWRGAATYEPCDRDANTNVGLTLRAAGVTVTFDPAKSVVRVGAHGRAKFPAGGWRSDDSVPHGAHTACGVPRGFERAFGAGKLVVLVPNEQLGGDSCFGLPAVDLALAVVLP